MFLNTNETQLILRDFLELLNSIESSEIVFHYKKYQPFTSDAQHAIYKFNIRKVDDEPVEVTSSAVQKIVTQFDLKILSFGIVKVGDCIFYIDPSFDMSKPDGTNEPVEDSLYIVDSSGIHWVPDLRRSNELAEMLMVKIGETQYANVIACEKRRDHE